MRLFIIGLQRDDCRKVGNPVTVRACDVRMTNDETKRGNGTKTWNKDNFRALSTSRGVLASLPPVSSYYRQGASARIYMVLCVGGTDFMIR
jgi:hypothetical protein